MKTLKKISMFFKISIITEIVSFNDYPAVWGRTPHGPRQLTAHQQFTQGEENIGRISTWLVYFPSSFFLLYFSFYISPVSFFFKDEIY